MLPYFTTKFGNPSSNTHTFGWEADETVKQAKDAIAEYIGAQSKEIIFTSGATESLNQAIRGIWDIYHLYGQHIITARTEHSAVLRVLEYLTTLGAQITYLDTDEFGNISLEQLVASITDQTIMICLMWANNETGVIYDVATIGKIAKQHNLIYVCDATQAVGKVSVDVQLTNIDVLAFSAHKFYGPKGIGGLYIRSKLPRVKISPLIYGGGQQGGMRGGTLNVPSIVGMKTAIDLINIEDEILRLSLYKSWIIEGLLAFWPIEINGDQSNCLANTLNLSFVGIKAERLLLKVQHQLAFSLGSACNAQNKAASHVLKAMQLSSERIDGAIRISLGRYTTELEIAFIIETFKKALK